MQSSERPTGVQSILQHFADLRDPRVANRCDYPFETVLVIGLLGVLCGAEGWTDLEVFAESKGDWLRAFLEMPEALPKEGVFRRLFSALRPAAFEACMRAWVRSLAEDLTGQVVAFDGKAMRGALSRAFGRTALHQVHAWAGSQRLLLAQRAVPGAPEESAAIVSMLEALHLKGAVVTIDAGNADKKVARAVIDQEADYVATVKANRKTFHTALATFFAGAEAAGFAGVTVRHQKTQERGHGRDEWREVWVVPAKVLGEMATYWPGLQSIVMVRRTRVLPDATLQSWTHYYASSLPPRVGPIANAIREHWSVENGLHWVLDVQMGEDACTIHDEVGATNFGLLRRMALTLLQRDDTLKRGVKAKQKKAGWNNDYLLHLLTRGLA
ncbi:MAG: ISAs1 family transposase [Deltaproteobacteria bacterium]|nr:ISAs1 family transposase [Myxococcales bacterium]MDP3213165.1 ISAs1 family transposase [Deltaproteobacteria bacterium]